MIAELIFILGTVGLFRIWMYSIGDPHAEEFNPRAVCSWYSQAIAEVRAFQLGIILPEHYNGDTSKGGKTLQRFMKIESDVLMIRSYGGWTQMLGFCSTCTSVWALLPIGLIYGMDSYGIALIISRIVFKYF